MWWWWDNVIPWCGGDRLKGELNSATYGLCKSETFCRSFSFLSPFFVWKELVSPSFDSPCIIHGAGQFPRARSCEGELKAVRVSSTRRLVWIDVQINGCVIQLHKKTREDDGVFALTTAWIALYRVLIYRNPNYEIIIYFIICTTRIIL